MRLRVAVRVVLASLFAILAAVCVATGAVLAHAELESSSPAAGSILAESPGRIVLTFTEAVSTVPDSIRLVTGDGSAVDIGDIAQDEGSSSITATVPMLTDGSYVVVWRAVSADSHPISGAFAFSVGASSTTDPELVSTLLDAERPDKIAETWLAGARAASYAGIAVVFGGFVIAAACATGVVASRRLGLLLVIGSVTATLGSTMMIAAQARLTVGSWTAWGDVIGSDSGRWWLVRVILLALTLPAVFVRRRFVGTGIVPAIGMVFAIAVLTVVTAGGHGISGRWIPLGFLATVLHLAAMCAWVGGLAVLAAAVPRAQLWSVASRFSLVALSSVVVLFVTGTANAARQASSWTALRESSYGSWLLVKLVLIASVLSIAALNRWLLQQATRRAPIGTAGSVGAATVAAPTDPALRRTVAVECAAMLFVFAATSGLVASPPARDAAAAPSIASATAAEGQRIAQLTLEPPVTAGTEMHVYITSSGGTIEQPDEITVSARLPAADIDDLDLPVTSAGPGHVTSSSANLPLPGAWTFIVTARYGEFESVVFALQLDVRPSTAQDSASAG